MLVLVCLLVGILASEIKDLAPHTVWMVIGLVSINILYYLPTWQGYAGHCVFLFINGFCFIVLFLAV
jgi:hypothetical protein